MKKTISAALLLAAVLCLSAGCSPAKSSVKYGENDFYAAAYIGSDGLSGLAAYEKAYPECAGAPVHYISGGEYYLVIPRYADASMKLYRADINGERTLLFESSSSAPFVVCCNVSDIISDCVVVFTRGSETVELSPYLSLENGAPHFGDRALDITKAG